MLWCEIYQETIKGSSNIFAEDRKWKRKLVHQKWVLGIGDKVIQGNRVLFFFCFNRLFPEYLEYDF